MANRRVGTAAPATAASSIGALVFVLTMLAGMQLPPSTNRMTGRRPAAARLHFAKVYENAMPPIASPSR
jgi:hypothetical protein